MFDNLHTTWKDYWWFVNTKQYAQFALVSEVLLLVFCDCSIERLCGKTNLIYTSWFDDNWFNSKLTISYSKQCPKMFHLEQPQLLQI